MGGLLGAGAVECMLLLPFVSSDIKYTFSPFFLPFVYFMWLSESNATTDEWRIYKIDEKLSVSPNTHNEKGRFLSVFFFANFFFDLFCASVLFFLFFCKHQMEMGTHFARIC